MEFILKMLTIAFLVSARVISIKTRVIHNGREYIILITINRALSK